MALGLLPAIRTDGVTDILVLVLMQFAEPAHRPLCNPCHPAYQSPTASTLLPNPHSARGTLIDYSPRVPSLEPFRRRPTALAATLVMGPASETLHKERTRFRGRALRAGCAACRAARLTN